MSLQKDKILADLHFAASFFRVVYKISKKAATKMKHKHDCA